MSTVRSLFLVVFGLIIGLFWNSHVAPLFATYEFRSNVPLPTQELVPHWSEMGLQTNEKVRSTNYTGSYAPQCGDDPTFLQTMSGLVFCTEYVYLYSGCTDGTCLWQTGSYPEPGVDTYYFYPGSDSDGLVLSLMETGGGRLDPYDYSLLQSELDASTVKMTSVVITSRSGSSGYIYQDGQAIPLLSSYSPPTGERVLMYQGESGEIMALLGEDGSVWYFNTDAYYGYRFETWAYQYGHKDYQKLREEHARLN